MGVNNGSTLLEEETLKEKSDQKTLSQILILIFKPRYKGVAQVSSVYFSKLELKLSAWLLSVRGSLTDCRQLAHYLSLLCFLLTVVTLLLTLCLVQLTLTSQSQSTLQETKVKDLTNRLEKLNQSHQLLFAQYPALNQYCPISNSTTRERECRPCLAGWTPQGEKCFHFSEDRANWISSQYLCMALGGAVATVKTEEEQVFLFQMAQRLSQGDSYWIGLRSSNGDGAWQWSDGAPLDDGPQFWEREPDKRAEGRELCGRLTPGDNYRRSWFLSRCSSQLRRICERRTASLQ